ncbi:MAG: peptidylprolyl isomerase [Hyphomicrobiales bacterium]|nr:peptidylprolyl isomerase [Hyphomicrobiales bacterium]MCY4048314.1 peptidylprolyl isomerase [Hyphomicrobiales bacterium]MCY4053863.1 peptidylprolyl isomerase [Hyphomicrobiales bacterium]
MMNAGQVNAQADKENLLHIDLKDGRVVVELLPEKAPQHVERIKKLAREKFYDGIIFHRVIDGFMAQTGDPTGTGLGGSDYPDVPLEISDASFTRGAVGMARSAAPNSANSQFFIMFEDAPHLNGNYTVWGRVIEGMDYVDAITRGEPPAAPDKMLRVRVASDTGE